MIARRSTIQEKSGKVTNNWAEESGMRHFIAVCYCFDGVSSENVIYRLLFVEPQIFKPQ